MRDAARLHQLHPEKLPEAQQLLPHWQTAVETLIGVAEGSPARLMLARIGMLRAMGGNVHMRDETISWSVAARVYWTILWRSIAMMLVIAMPFNFLLTWLLINGRLDREGLLFWSKQFMALTVLCVLFFAVRMALRKRYRGFRIQVVCD